MPADTRSAEGWSNRASAVTCSFVHMWCCVPRKRVRRHGVGNARQISGPDAEEHEEEDDLPIPEGGKYTPRRPSHQSQTSIFTSTMAL